jgi:hypothetical protein
MVNPNIHRQNLLPGNTSNVNRRAFRQGRYGGNRLRSKAHSISQYDLQNSNFNVPATLSNIDRSTSVRHPSIPLSQASNNGSQTQLIAPSPKLPNNMLGRSPSFHSELGPPIGISGINNQNSNPLNDRLGLNQNPNQSLNSPNMNQINQHQQNTNFNRLGMINNSNRSIRTRAMSFMEPKNMNLLTPRVQQRNQNNIQQQNYLQMNNNNNTFDSGMSSVGGFDSESRLSPNSMVNQANRNISDGNTTDTSYSMSKPLIKPAASSSNISNLRRAYSMTDLANGIIKKEGINLSSDSKETLATNLADPSVSDLKIPSTNTMTSNISKMDQSVSSQVMSSQCSTTDMENRPLPQNPGQPVDLRLQTAQAFIAETSDPYTKAAQSMYEQFTPIGLEPTKSVQGMQQQQQQQVNMQQQVQLRQQQLQHQQSMSRPTSLVNQQPTGQFAYGTNPIRTQSMGTMGMNQNSANNNPFLPLNQAALINQQAQNLAANHLGLNPMNLQNQQQQQHQQQNPGSNQNVYQAAPQNLLRPNQNTNLNRNTSFMEQNPNLQNVGTPNIGTPNVGTPAMGSALGTPLGSQNTAPMFGQFAPMRGQMQPMNQGFF